MATQHMETPSVVERDMLGRAQFAAAFEGGEIKLAAAVGEELSTELLVGEEDDAVDATSDAADSERRLETNVCVSETSAPLQSIRTKTYRQAINNLFFLVSRKVYKQFLCFVKLLELIVN